MPGLDAVTPASASSRATSEDTVSALLHEGREAAAIRSAFREEQAVTVLNEVLDEVEREEGDKTVCHREVIEGPAHRVLQDVSEQAGLLVVGSLHRRDRSGLRLGRVSHAMLHRAACPVAVVPQRV
ncbi:universal stress protein [Streptomyces sp. NPDC019937]|uniref:universal stress protein n=1 Tax=Streptomyces sp. NPDC019937 TaxID=3154787 RepID=UPI0033F9893B